MQEKWKDIPTWEGIYKNSNFGRVKRLYKNGNERILNPFVECGYYHVKLTYKGREETWKRKNNTLTMEVL